MKSRTHHRNHTIILTRAVLLTLIAWGCLCMHLRAAELDAVSAFLAERKAFIEQKMKEGREMLLLNNPTAALVAFSAVLSRVDKKTDPLMWADATLMRAEAKGLQFPGCYAPDLEEVIQIYQKRLPATDTRMAMACNQLARSEGNPDKAMSLVERAITIEEKLHGPSGRYMADILWTKAALLEKATPTKAQDGPLEDALRRMLHIDEACLCPGHSRIGADLKALFTFYRSRNRPKELDQIETRRLALCEERFQNRKPNRDSAFYELESLLREYAWICQWSNRPARAEELLKRSVDAAEETYGREDTRTQSSRTALAKFYKDTNRPDDAAAEAVRWLTSYETTWGKEDARLAYPLQQLADYYEAANRFDDAASQIARLIAIQEKSSGKQSLELAPLLQHLARCYLKGEHFNEAVSQYEKVLKIHETGPGQTGIAEDLHELANAYLRARRPDDAERTSRRALDIMYSESEPNRQFFRAMITVAPACRPMLRPLIVLVILNPSSSESSHFNKYHELLANLGLSSSAIIDRAEAIFLGEDPGPFTPGGS